MDFKNIYYRPHLSYLFEQCPSSVERNLKFIAKHEVGLPAILGTACDQIFKEHISKDGEITDEILAEVADKYKIAVEGYEGIGWRVHKLQKNWKKITAQFFNNPVGETTWPTKLKNGYEFDSKPDLHEAHEDWGAVLELKMGQNYLGWDFQSRDYCISMLKQYPYLETIFSIVLGPIADYYSVKKFTREDLEKLEDDIVKKFDDVGVKYVVGNACQYCPRLLNCPAIKNQIDPISTDIANVASKNVEIGSDEIQKWRGPVKAMEAIITAYKEAEKLVVERMGTVDLGNGTELFFKERKDKEVDVSEALNVLVGMFGVEKEEFIKHLNITSGNVEYLASSTAEKGMKGKRKKEVWELLKENGGLEINITKVLSTRVKTTKLEGEKVNE